MSNNVQPIPAGYHTITPFLIVQDAMSAIEFYKKAFNAKEIMRFDKPDGTIGHAELQIGDSRIMLSDECPSLHAHSPKQYQGTPVGIHLYVTDVDATISQAVAAGAKVLRRAADMFYGDRSGMIEDPSGHMWSIATHIEDLTVDEINERASKMYSN